MELNLKIETFSYTRADGSETFDDGEAVVIDNSIRISMWGKEITYFYTESLTQAGDLSCVLVINQVDNQIRVEKLDRNTSLSRRASISEMAQKTKEAVYNAHLHFAGIIGKHCDSESKMRIHRIFDLMYKM